MTKDKSGIYQIECRANGRLYIGSSKNIYVRWYEHRRLLRCSRHTTPHLQFAWNKYGEDAFRFSIIEECEPAALEEREQHYIDVLKPAFNSITDIKRRSGPEQRANLAAAIRARAVLITHCPRGHAYDDANTYLNAKGKRICRACNAERVSGVYAQETPEQREARRVLVKAGYEKNREVRLAKQREYMATHKAEKSEYDRQRREALRDELARRRAEKRKNETPEQREIRLRRKRESYQRSQCFRSPHFPP